MEMNCIAGITTYNPNLERLKQNVAAISNQVDKVLIVDNGSDNIDEIEKLSLTYNNIVTIKNKKNMGIAFAMNRIGEYAFQQGYEWFMTLDQDSICPENLISTYFKYVKDNVGIIAPYIHFNSSFILSLMHLNKRATEERDDVREVKYVISSGQFIQTKAWKKVDGFWEYLFIDYVDQEFCFHITREGYKILQVNNIELDHEPGIEVKIFGISTAKQSAMREYYWARNSRLVFWLYKREYMNAIGKQPIISTSKRIANSILVRENVGDKLRAIFKGVRDSYRWKKEYLNHGRVPDKL